MYLLQLVQALKYENFSDIQGGLEPGSKRESQGLSDDSMLDRSEQHQKKLFWLQTSNTISQAGTRRWVLFYMGIFLACQEVVFLHSGSKFTLQYVCLLGEHKPPCRFDYFCFRRRIEVTGYDFTGSSAAESRISGCLLTPLPHCYVEPKKEYSIKTIIQQFCFYYRTLFKMRFLV